MSSSSRFGHGAEMADDGLVWYDSDGQVVGVGEFQIVKALLEGRDLSQLVASQWGPVHFFDLCMSFGHQDTALAMAEAGVAGCILEARHLGPFGRASAETDLCRCAGWWTCDLAAPRHPLGFLAF